MHQALPSRSIRWSARRSSSSRPQHPHPHVRPYHITTSATASSRAGSRCSPRSARATRRPARLLRVFRRVSPRRPPVITQSTTTTCGRARPPRSLAADLSVWLNGHEDSAGSTHEGAELAEMPRRRASVSPHRQREPASKPPVLLGCASRASWSSSPPRADGRRQYRRAGVPDGLKSTDKDAPSDGSSPA